MALKGDFACPYAHASAIIENLPAAQNLLGLFRKHKMITWCCAALLSLGHFLRTLCCVWYDMLYLATVV